MAIKTVCDMCGDDVTVENKSITWVRTEDYTIHLDVKMVGTKAGGDVCRECQFKALEAVFRKK